MAGIPRVTAADQATKETVNRSAGARPAVYRRLPTGGSLVGARCRRRKLQDEVVHFPRSLTPSIGGQTRASPLPEAEPVDLLYSQDIDDRNRAGANVFDVFKSNVNEDVRN